MSNQYTQGIIGANGKAIENVTITTFFDKHGADGKSEAAFAAKFHQSYPLMTETQLSSLREDIVRQRTRKEWAAQGAEEAKYFPVAQ